jgi:hypothetical protein
LEDHSQKVDECAKMIAIQSAKGVVKQLGRQLSETGIFQPEELNRDVNQQVKKKVPLYEHKRRKFLAVHPFATFQVESRLGSM